MRPRHNLVETFSSFVQFEADRFHRWGSDPRLKRNMQQRSHEATINNPPRFWVLYWHKCWQANPQSLAKAHLLSYLQEACYWVAYKAGTSFTSTQYGVSDCFQMAIAHLDKVLSGFNAEQGFDLKSYASAAFSSLIRDQLRQRKEVDICTDWSLLRKVSQKRLTLALQARGLPSTEIERYLLTWRAYQLVYTPEKSGSTRKLSAPSAASWQAIAQQANADRVSLTQPGKPITTVDAEAWIAIAAKSVRSYLYPGSVSMNTTVAGQDVGEYIDTLSDDEQDTPLGEMIEAEEGSRRSQQQAQLGDVLTGAIAQLEGQSQRLLTLYYQDGATQKEIASQLGMKQYGISRALSRVKKQLITALAQWGQETLHITPSPDVLKHTSAALEAWLTAHYQRVPTAL